MNVAIEKQISSNWFECLLLIWKVNGKSSFIVYSEQKSLFPNTIDTPWINIQAKSQINADTGKYRHACKKHIWREWHKTLGMNYKLLDYCRFKQSFQITV